MTAGAPMATRPRWRLAPHTFWANDRTLVGGDPFRSLRLTPPGAAFVRAVLTGDRNPGSAVETALLDRLSRANLLTRPTQVPVQGRDVTLVVPARSTPGPVQRVLDSAPGVPAIVVDDGSPEPLAGVLTHDGPLRVVRHDASRGPAAARNAGAGLVETSWIAFADADVIAPEGWIDALLAYGHLAIAIAPRIESGPGGGLAGRLERAACALDMGSEPGFVNPSGVLAYVPSAALLVRRDALSELGGFDEAMQVGEDVDLIWRAAEHGVYYEPSVVVHHAPRPAIVAVLRRRAAYGSSAAALAARHPERMHHGSFPATSALPWLLLLAGRPRLAAASSALQVALAPRAMPQLPAAGARRAVATGQYRTALALSRNLTRPLFPVSIGVSLAHNGLRHRILALAGLAAVASRRSPEPTLWKVVDDAAYSAGVWLAAARSGHWRIVAPRLRTGARRD